MVEEARKRIQDNAFYMTKALDAQNLKEAMKFADQMVGSLRVGSVSPREYYSLFLQVFDELNLLEMAFVEAYNKKKIKISKIYEKVQYSQELIPRLYLMITAGSVLIDSREMTSVAVIQDLFQMLKGVQHPFRGLFLRFYFLKMIKRKIPDADQEDYQEKLEREFGCLDNILNMLSENFGEMNKLWIRIGTLIKDKKSRKQQREELKMTVGENIVRLAGIQGLTVDVYKQKLLPMLLEHIVSCGDKMSQSYLFNCLIHAFPDEFHLETLEMMLRATEDLNPKVALREIYIKIMDRLAEYAKRAENGEAEKTDMVKVYQMFKKSIANIVSKQTEGEVQLHKILELQSTFLKFCVNSFPGVVEYVDEILQISVALCSKVSASEYTEEVLDSLVSILSLPLDSLALAVLGLEEYPRLMNYLPFIKRKKVALKILEAVLNSRTYILRSDVLMKVLVFINPLFETGDSESIPPTADELQDQLCQLGRLFHLCESHDPHVTVELLKRIEKKVRKLDSSWKKSLVPSLVTCYFRTVRRFKELQPLIAANPEDLQTQIQAPFEARVQAASYLSEDEKNGWSYTIPTMELNPTDLLTAARAMIEDVAYDYPVVAVRLYLQLISLVKACNEGEQYKELLGDLAEEALELFQDEVSDPKEKAFIFENILGTFIPLLPALADDARETVSHNLTLFASSLLRKRDKVLMLLKVLSVHFNPPHLVSTG